MMLLYVPYRWLRFLAVKTFVLPVVLALVIYFANAYAMETSDNDEARLTAQLVAPSLQSANYKGNESAKVTMIEFGDYQCTFCKRFHSYTKDLVINNFVKTGVVKFLFKDYPVNDIAPSNSSTFASEASYCAADQSKYWEYYDQLYDNSRGENTGWISQNSLIGFAKLAGIHNLTAFSDCLISHKYSNLVQRNYDLAMSLKLTATPSFVLMAKDKEPLVVVGSQPFEVFDHLIRNMMS
jgi:protein-disulfide isomerase